MAWLRGAVSFVPVVGPAVDVLDSAAQGDHVGAAVQLCGLALDVCTALGPMGGPRRTLQVAKVARKAVGHVRASATKRAALRSTVSHVTRFAAASARGARHVVKTRLKQQVRAEARRTALKLGLAAVGTLAEASRQRARDLRRAARPAEDAARRAGWSSAAWALQGMQAVYSRLPCTGQGPAASLASTFALAGCSDSQLHAAFAHAVYSPSEERQGMLATLDRAPDGPRSCWYAYVGGDKYRGFWYSPEPRHLVLAERGTCVDDMQDLQRDICIAVGAGLAAVSNRAWASKVELKRQAECHGCDRITVTGHSLGGAMALFLASTASKDVRVDAAHAFNPGGLTDLSRYVAVAMARADIKVHHILGDPLSVSFLPFLQQRYAKREGHEDVDPHRMLHFL